MDKQTSAMNVLAQLMMKDAAKRDTHYELQKSVNYWDLNVVCTFGIFLMVCLIQCHLVYMLLGEVDLIVCGMQSMLNTHFLLYCILFTLTLSVLL